MKRINTIAYLLAVVLLLSSAFLVIFDHAMLKGYFRDENQFVASGKLLEAEGLLPYRDYPYFHMPNLVFIYAAIYKLTDFTLLGARTFSVLCAWAAGAALLYAAQRFYRHRSRWLGLSVGAGAFLLLLPNPLFRFTSGLAWNHDFPVLLTLAATISVLSMTSQQQTRWSGLGSGFLLGLAVGARLTFLAALVPFLGYYALSPQERTLRGRIRSLSLFLAGFFLAMLPSLILFSIAPKQFIFGNIEYARLNTLYRLATEFEGPMTLNGKLIFLLQRVLDQPGTAITLVMFVLFTLNCLTVNLAGFIPPPQPSKGQEEGGSYSTIVFNIIFLISLLLCLLAGAFLPTPTWYQYFYTPLPLIILGIIYTLSCLDRLSRPVHVKSLLVFILGIFLVNFFHFDQYPNLRRLAHPGSWYPIQTRVLGHKIQSITGDGRVLTLSPLFPLDGGAKIYPQYATGPFAWRVADLLTEEQRSLYRIGSKNELVRDLENHPPGGILVGLTKDAEGFFLDYARQKEYNPVDISKDLILWVPK